MLSDFQRSNRVRSTILLLYKTWVQTLTMYTIRRLQLDQHIIFRHPTHKDEDEAHLENVQVTLPLGKKTGDGFPIPNPNRILPPSHLSQLVLMLVTFLTNPR